MLNVGLTGNIAAGKSVVVGFLRRWGATIIDADELVRAAQSPGSEALSTIVRRFGADVLASDGALDRAALRSKVMGDEAALAALNAIVHPVVQRRRADLQREAELRGDVLVVNDIPLLFEATDPAQFDAIVLVDAPISLRRARLRAMRGFSNEDADRMIAAQMPAERKRAASQFVIENAGSLQQLETQTRTVFRELRRHAAVQALGTDVQPPLLLLVADAKEDPAAFPAVQARYRDAGATVQRIAAMPAELSGQLAKLKPQAIVATARVADAVRRAWEDSGRPGALLYLNDDPDPVAVRLDLRPWGGEVVALAEEGAAGLPPRADLFRASK